MTEFYSKANECYVDEQFEDALKYYSQAIEAEGGNAEFYVRRSQAHAKLENYQAAEKDARTCVELNPTNYKGHLRLGEALFKMDNYEEALKEFKEAEQIEPDDNKVKTWLKKCELLVEEATTEEPTIEEVTTEEATVEEVTTEEATIEEATTEEPTVEEVTTKEPTIEEVTTREATIEEVTTEEPTIEEVTTREATIEEVTTREATIEEIIEGATIEEITEEATIEEIIDDQESSAQDTVSEPAVKEIPMPPVEKQRYDWYQTETHVVINILIKRANKDDVDISYSERSMSATVKQPSGTDYSLELDLAYEIVPAKSITKVLGSKIELKMKKAEGIRWSTLQGEGQQQVTRQENIVRNYPSASHYTRNWDKVVQDFEKNEEELTGEAAVNNLFQKIYSDGSDDVRRAMNKSYSESGGTVLSTNWSDIGKKKTDVKAPDGVEYKKWGK